MGFVILLRGSSGQQQKPDEDKCCLHHFEMLPRFGAMKCP
jgi:hypothetical protein